MPTLITSSPVTESTSVFCFHFRAGLGTASRRFVGVADFRSFVYTQMRHRFQFGNAAGPISSNDTIDRRVLSTVLRLGLDRRLHRTGDLRSGQDELSSDDQWKLARISMRNLLVHYGLRDIAARVERRGSSPAETAHAFGRIYRHLRIRTSVSKFVVL